MAAPYVSDNVVILPNAAGGAAFTAAETGLWVLTPGAICNYEATLANTTTPAATADIHGSNSNLNAPGAGTKVGDFTLDTPGQPVNGSKDMAAYKYTCVVVNTITGAGASASFTVSGAL